MTQNNREAGSNVSLSLAWLADEPAAASLIGVCFDFMMNQPVSRFVTPAQVLEHLETALRPEHVKRVVTAHIQEVLRRERQRAAERDDQLGDYLTPEARELILQFAARPVRLNPKLLEQLIRHDAVKHLVRVMVEETLGRFVQMLKPGLGSGPLGKGLFARLGAQMESQLSKAAAGFVASSLDFLLGRLSHVLATAETGDRLGRMRAEGCEAGLKLGTSGLWDLTENQDLQELLAVVPGLVEKNLACQEIREVILSEAGCALQIEGERTLGELLEPRAVAIWRDKCMQIAGPLLTELVQTGSFENWLAEAARNSP